MKLLKYKRIRSLDVLSLSNCPIIALNNKIKTIILKTNVLPNNVVSTTVTNALIRMIVWNDSTKQYQESLQINIKSSREQVIHVLLKRLLIMK